MVARQEHDDERGLNETRALLGEVDAARAEVRARLVGAGAHEPLGDLGEELCVLTARRVALAERVVVLRLQALARVHEGLARLAACTSVEELLDAGARELAATCDLDRAVVSRLADQRWRAEAIWLHPEVDQETAQATVEYLTRDWIALRRGVLEADLARRGTAEVVSADDRRTDKELMAATRSRAYVAAPVMPGGRVIGFLQADCFVSGHELTSDDRDLVWAFAQGFGVAVERVSLSARLDQQLARARTAFAEAERQLEELAHDQVRLVRGGQEPDVVATRAPQMFLAQPDGGPLPLTRREVQVAELLLEGARNDDIARRLDISRETVKNHLSAVLRKLGVATRAEAVAVLLRARAG